MTLKVILICQGCKEFSRQIASSQEIIGQKPFIKACLLFSTNPYIPTYSNLHSI